jgi:hypothetical protein
MSHVGSLFGSRLCFSTVASTGKIWSSHTSRFFAPCRPDARPRRLVHPHHIEKVQLHEIALHERMLVSWQGEARTGAAIRNRTKKRGKLFPSLNRPVFTWDSTPLQVAFLLALLSYYRKQNLLRAAAADSSLLFLGFWM